MTRAERLESQIGKTVRQSIGQDRPTLAIASVPIADPRHDGLKRSRRDYREIPTDKLMPDPMQPRKTIEDSELDELGASLGTRGQLQPAKVYWSEADARYVLVYGEKRLRAALRVGLGSLHCEILEAKPDEATILEEQLAENGAGRSAPPPIETGMAYIRLMELRGWTEVELAQHLGVSQATVSNRLGLARMPEPVKDMVREKKLTPSAATEILRAPEDVQVGLAISAVESGLNRDQVRAEVGAILGRRSAGPPLAPAPVPAAEILAANIRDGLPVSPPESSRPEETVKPTPVAKPAVPAKSAPKAVAGWTIHRDGSDTEALFALGDGQGIAVNLTGPFSAAVLVKVLSGALKNATLLDLFARVPGGPVVPGDRVLIGKPDHDLDGQVGEVLDELDPSGFLMLRVGKKTVPFGIRYLRKIDQAGAVGG